MRKRKYKDVEAGAALARAFKLLKKKWFVDYTYFLEVLMRAERKKEMVDQSSYLVKGVPI